MSIITLLPHLMKAILCTLVIEDISRVMASPHVEQLGFTTAGESTQFWVIGRF